MNVRRRPNPKQKRELTVKAQLRAAMGGYQDAPERIVPLDKGTLLAYAILWYSDQN